MVLCESTWQEVEQFSKSGLVLLPTGAIEQHGPHLPLVTDTLIVEEIARDVERRMPDSVLLCPTLWLGNSLHHLPFSGSLSATFEGYEQALLACISSLQHHRFHTFYVLNGHGGNSDSNRIALKRAKHENPNHRFAHASYFELIEHEIAATLRGPSRQMTHGCEAETSLMLHLRPDLVKLDQAQVDGMTTVPNVRGRIQTFEEITNLGSIGYPTYATADTGATLFQASVDAVVRECSRFLEPSYSIADDEKAQTS